MKSQLEKDSNVNWSSEGTATSAVGDAQHHRNVMLTKSSLMQENHKTSVRMETILTKSHVTICFVSLENCFHSKQLYNERSKTIGNRRKARF